MAKPVVEFYGGPKRDALLAIEQFDTLLKAQVLVADWRTKYHHYWPPVDHDRLLPDTLKMLAPAEFADSTETPAPGPTPEF